MRTAGPVNAPHLATAGWAMLDTQVGDIERRIDSVMAQKEASAAKARLLWSIPGIGPVSAAMLIAELPELGRMTSGEAAQTRHRRHRAQAGHRKLVTIANAILKTGVPWRQNAVP
jgi:transposase